MIDTVPDVVYDFIECQRELLDLKLVEEALKIAKNEPGRYCFQKLLPLMWDLYVRWN